MWAKYTGMAHTGNLKLSFWQKEETRLSKESLQQQKMNCFMDIYLLLKTILWDQCSNKQFKPQKIL